jgi:hypothetical protein
VLCRFPGESALREPVSVRKIEVSTSILVRM